jgi:S-adenosylmethionine:tRNA ribosyltransferase-isomerase
MKTKDFSFDLPPELIAQYPSDKREDARLLVVDTKTDAFVHSRVQDISRHLDPDTLVVVNDSKVRKARIHGRPIDAEGSVEFLLLKASSDARRWDCLVRRAKRRKVGRVYRFPDGITGTIVAADGPLRTVEFSAPIRDVYLDLHGSMPLPPYIRREPSSKDDERYQTVYAREYGSVAAPTAGLHFTNELLSDLAGSGVEIRSITLHVGLGTFAPVRSEDIENHRMHREELEIDSETAHAVERARMEGRPVLAVGTTSVRALESASRYEGRRLVVRPGRRSTDIFIRPGYQFKTVSRMFTNFHTPESTLLMLVSAFAGYDRIRRAYREAIRRKYRFFSYGDAMLIR